MLIRKSKNVMSAGAEKFIKSYADKYPTHKIFIEFPVIDFINNILKRNKKEISAVMKARASRLTFDFYDETADIVFETNGEQHYKFNEFFHGDIGKFDRQRSNDFMKQMICDFCGTQIRFIDLNKDKDYDY